MTERSETDRNRESESVCCICRHPIDTPDDTLVQGVLSNGHRVYAHALCAESIRAILGAQSDAGPATQLLAGLVREFRGDWILSRRQFANEYLPILAFFYLNRNEPMSTVELTQWLTRNGVKLSNPSMSIKRLAGRSSLSVIVDEGGTKSYLLTDVGEAELRRYVDDLRSESGE